MSNFILFVFSVFRGFHSVIIKITQKNYVKKFSDTIFLTFIYSFIQAFFLLLMLPFTGCHYKLNMLVNPLFYAIFSCVSIVMYISAIGKGSNSLTNIINSFMLLVPIIAGLIFWGDSINIYQYSGLILFSIIIFIFNKGTKCESTDAKHGNTAWLILSIASALFGGISITFTKRHSLMYSNSIMEYLVAINVLMFLISLPYVLWARFKRKYKFNFDKRYFLFITIIAIIQDVSNVIYMVFISKLKSASFFPLMGILNIISVIIMNRILLKERISKLSYVGIALSLIAIYLLG